jgi:hypothetical protein
MRTLILALALAVGGARAQAQPSDMLSVDGTCDASSHVAEGNIGENLTKRQSRFFCDIAVFFRFADSPDHVMIQFTERKSHHGSTLGFGGRLTDGGVTVDHFYLDPGRPITPDVGGCRFFYKGKKMATIWCAAKIDEEGRRTTAVVDFKVH